MNGFDPSPPRTATPTAQRSLATPVAELPGVTPLRAEQLARLELDTARDVLFRFPRDYCDLTDIRPVSLLEEGKLQSVLGTVEDIDSRRLRSGRTLVAVLIRQDSQFLRGLWFNASYMRDKFSFGQRVMFSGKPKRQGPRWEMSHPRVQWLNDEDEDAVGRLVPIYPLTEGLKQRHLRWLMRIVLEQYAGLVEETFPPEFLAAHQLWPIHRALPEIHFPSSHEALTLARRRFVYQELFILQLALAIKRRQLRDQARAPRLEPSALIDARIRHLFPFELTAGQRQAIAEISADLAQPFPMQRLLQGDVGSGKTIVALYALLLAVAHGYQGVLMAPTEVLARQHARTLDRLLADSKVRRGLLVGGLTQRERQQLLEQIAAGQVDLVIGTQAVVQDGVEFAKLGLIVIDEQHKFGVRQRATLKVSQQGTSYLSTAAPETPQTTFEFATPPPLQPTPPSPDAAATKSLHAEPHDAEPHYLVMTATPIPRTIALSLFGDLDVTTLRDAPPGRQKIHTYLAGPDRRSRWWEFFRKKLNEGRQGYVVAPLIEDSEEIEAASLNQVYEALADGELAAYRLALLYGRLSSAEKQDVMDRFHRRELQVLICTSVIEVGIDVPNATLMTIEGGERFGLSQLHQLRGRISRGSHPGYCCVFAEPQSLESQRRLEAFVSTTDGFELAEADLALRGPGELFGTRQHGIPPFRIADLIRDAELLTEARADAAALVDTDPGLSQPAHARLRRMVLVRYGKALDLGTVG